MLRAHGYGPLPVNFLGKAATFNLLYAFPMLLAALPERHGWLATVFRPLGWAFATWGTALYWVAGVALHHPGAPARARGPAGARGAGGPGVTPAPSTEAAR